MKVDEWAELGALQEGEGGRGSGRRRLAGVGGSTRDKEREGRRGGGLRQTHPVVCPDAGDYSRTEGAGGVHGGARVGDLRRGREVRSGGGGGGVMEWEDGVGEW